MSAGNGAAPARPAITIDKGVPMPKAGSGRRKNGGRKPLYPLRSMEVGDSFAVVVHADRGAHRTQRGLTKCAHALPDRKFSTRQVEENGVRVVRVWRVS